MKVRGSFCLMNKIVFEINGSLIKALKQGHTKSKTESLLEESK